MSVTAYTFAKDLSHSEITAIAEQVPDGPSTRELMNLSKEFNIAVLAGLIEKSDGKLRSEEHTSELQSRGHLVCRLLLEKKKHSKQHERTLERSEELPAR